MQQYPCPEYEGRSSRRLASLSTKKNKLAFVSNIWASLNVSLSGFQLAMGWGGDPSWISMKRCLLYTFAPWIDLTPLNSPPTPLQLSTHGDPRWGVEEPPPLSSAYREQLTVWLTLIPAHQKNYSKGDRPLGTCDNKPVTPDYHWLPPLCVYQYV